MCTIYILKLEGDKYYVGKSRSLDIRLEDHFNGSGSKWTQLYKPIEVIETHENCSDFDEDKYTIMTMEKYGINNVRGGSFSTIELSNEDKKLIHKMI